jgi:hypothetical protein
LAADRICCNVTCSRSRLGGQDRSFARERVDDRLQPVVFGGRRQALVVQDLIGGGQ